MSSDQSGSETDSEGFDFMRTKIKPDWFKDFENGNIGHDDYPQFEPVTRNVPPKNVSRKPVVVQKVLEIIRNSATSTPLQNNSIATVLEIANQQNIQASRANCIVENGTPISPKQRPQAPVSIKHCSLYKY